MKIYNEILENALNRVEDKNVNILVVGAGTIGLPLATFLANHGFNVICYDKNEDRVKQINEGQVFFEYHEELKRALEKGNIRATIDPAEVNRADIVFVCVPTPLTKEKAMDISMLLDVADKLGRYISKGHLIVFESSVAIGTTAVVKEKLEEISGLTAGVDFGVAYCPERYNPGLPSERHPELKYEENVKTHDYHRLDVIGRVIGAIDQKSLLVTKAVYSKIIKSPIKTVSSIETAEATKLLENIFRDVNIALVNELAKVYSKFGVDVYEVIDAAKSKPFAFMPHYPGAGVGGECIPVDTHYLIKQADEIGLDTVLMKAAREVNDSMPDYTIELLRHALGKTGRSLENSTICVLGASYKKNIDDIRLSPGLLIADKLAAAGADVKVCDPIVNPAKLKKYNLVPIDAVLDGTDGLILVTDHDKFKTIDFPRTHKTVIVDGRNFFLKDALESLGYTYVCVGKHSP